RRQTAHLPSQVHGLPKAMAAAAACLFAEIVTSEKRARSAGQKCTKHGSSPNSRGIRTHGEYRRGQHASTCCHRNVKPVQVKSMARVAVGYTSVTIPLPWPAVLFSVELLQINAISHGWRQRVGGRTHHKQFKERWIDHEEANYTWVSVPELIAERCIA